ncbi:MAG: fatty acid desaturase family protein [Alphaproteobacteria bacterium]
MTDVVTELTEKGRYIKTPAREIFTEDELNILRKKSNWKASWMIMSSWGIVFGAMAMFAMFPNPVTFVLAVMLIGSRQLGLAVAMHDAAHNSMYTHPKVNDLVCNWLAAYPTATDIKPYRPYHLVHHRKTGQPEDPDLHLAHAYPITPASFRRKAFRDLKGETGWKQRKAQWRGAIGPAEWPLARRLKNLWARLGGFFITNAILFAALALAGYWYLYPLLWIVPMLTWYQFISRVRNMAEHACVGDADDDFRNARTTLAGPIMRLFLAPNYVNYHCEHHLLYWVPSYNLPTMHKMLMAKGYGDRMEVKQGYFDMMKIAVREDAKQVRRAATVLSAPFGAPQTEEQPFNVRG